MHNATRILVNYPDLPGFSRAREQGNYLKLEILLACFACSSHGHYLETGQLF